MASCTSPRPFISAPGGIRVQWVFTQSFSLLSFHLDFYSPVDPIPEYLEMVAQEAAAFWNGDISPHIAGLLAPATAIATELTTEFTESFGFECEGTGGALWVPAPNNICQLYRFITAASGRSARGRIFVPDVPQVMVKEDGRLQSDPFGATPFIPFWDNFMNNHRLPPFYLTPVVWSYCHDHAWRSIAVKNEITRVIWDPMAHSKHKRLFGR